MFHVKKQQRKEIDKGIAYLRSSTAGDSDSSVHLTPPPSKLIGKDDATKVAEAEEDESEDSSWGFSDDESSDVVSRLSGLGNSGPHDRFKEYNATLPFLESIDHDRLLSILAELTATSESLKNQILEKAREKRSPSPGPPTISVTSTAIRSESLLTKPVPRSNNYQEEICTGNSYHCYNHYWDVSPQKPDVRSSGGRHHSLRFSRTHQKDWNQEYQELLSATNEITRNSPMAMIGTEERTLDAYKKLYQLENDFVTVAVMYSKIIVSELMLPDEYKTIKPVKIGGIAGGDKYIKNGILYKLAVDTVIGHEETNSSDGDGTVPSKLWMYGGKNGPADEYAIKSAGCELNGIQGLMASEVPGLCFPMMCIIDYCGFRITASSLLPVNKESIRYGSDDGGLSVHADIPELNELMREAASRLGLAGHEVKGKEIYGPGDIEGHLGTDGRYYVVDFARTTPPEAPPDNLTEWNKEPRAIFYKMLRPELVRQYKETKGKNLCSDAFSAWNRYNTHRKSTEEEVRRATQWMLSKVIPEFAEQWEKRRHVVEYIAWARGTTKWTTSQIVESLRSAARELVVGEFHAMGCNVRHMGLVRQLVHAKELKQLILSICLARVCKGDIHKEMRKTMQEMREKRSCTPSQGPFKGVILFHITRLLGGQSAENEAACEQFWKRDVKWKLENQFKNGLTREEKDPSYDLRLSIQLQTFFVLLLEIVGTKVPGQTLESLVTAPGRFTLLMTDLLSIRAKVKRTWIANLASGVQHLVEAQRANERIRELKGDKTRIRERTSLEDAMKRKLLHSQNVLKEAYLSCPSSPLINVKYGECLAELGQLETRKEERQEYFSRAYHHFEIALKVNKAAKEGDSVEINEMWSKVLLAHAEKERQEGNEEEARRLMHSAEGKQKFCLADVSAETIRKAEEEEGQVVRIAGREERGKRKQRFQQRNAAPDARIRKKQVIQQQEGPTSKQRRRK